MHLAYIRFNMIKNKSLSESVDMLSENQLTKSDKSCPI